MKETWQPTGTTTMRDPRAEVTSTTLSILGPCPQLPCTETLTAHHHLPTCITSQARIRIASKPHVSGCARGNATCRFELCSTEMRYSLVPYAGQSRLSPPQNGVKAEICSGGERNGCEMRTPRWSRLLHLCGVRSSRVPVVCAVVACSMQHMVL